MKDEKNRKWMMVGFFIALTLISVFGSSSPDVKDMAERMTNIQMRAFRDSLTKVYAVSSIDIKDNSKMIAPVVRENAVKAEKYDSVISELRITKARLKFMEEMAYEHPNMFTGETSKITNEK